MEQSFVKDETFRRSAGRADMKGDVISNVNPGSERRSDGNARTLSREDKCVSERRDSGPASHDLLRVSSSAPTSDPRPQGPNPPEGALPAGVR